MATRFGFDQMQNKFVPLVTFKMRTRKNQDQSKQGMPDKSAPCKSHHALSKASASKSPHRSAKKSSSHQQRNQPTEMKIKLLVVFSLLAMPLFSLGQRHILPLRSHYFFWMLPAQLKGISQIHYEEYQYSSFLIKKKKPYLKRETTLDSLGRAIRVVESGRYISPPSTTTWSYDSQGCPVNQSQFTAPGDSSRPWLEFHCADGGQVDTMTNWFSMQQSVFEYDANGHLNSEKTLKIDSAGARIVLSGGVRYQYDKNGVLLRMESDGFKAVSEIKDGHYEITVTTQNGDDLYKIELNEKGLPARILGFYIIGKRKRKSSESHFEYSYD
jgi:hypothetical protein